MAVYAFNNHGIPKWLQSIMLLSMKITIVGNEITSYLFKPGAPAAGRCAPGFLVLLLSANFSMCVCVRP